MASGKVNFPKFGRRDRQVKPVEGNDKFHQNKAGKKSSELKTISKQVDTKLTEKEMKRIKEVEEQRMKDIDKDNRRMKRKMLRKQVRKDIAQTSSESCATFCFVFIVGSILLGGGTALIESGKENDVFDFVVVGATGLVCGVIFTVVGIYLFVKPLYDRHLERKTAGLDSWGEQKEEGTTKPYIDQEHAKRLQFQIHDKKQHRRPSYSDLYGDRESFDNMSAMTTPRDQSFTSYTKPPFVAVPNNERESFSKKPVILLDAKDTGSPKKGKRSTAATTTNSSVEEASLSHVDETVINDKVVTFSKKNDVKQYEVNTRSQEYEMHEDQNKHENNSSSGNCEDSNYDKILKHASRNTIVIDYSLLNELETAPPTSGEAPSVDRSHVTHFTKSHHSLDNGDMEFGTTNQTQWSENIEAQKHSDLTKKLYEKHPDVADKHKKRSKRRKRHSEKNVQTHNTQSEITIPLNDSETERAESIC